MSLFDDVPEFNWPRRPRRPISDAELFKMMPSTTWRRIELAAQAAHLGDHEKAEEHRVVAGYGGISAA